MLKFVESLTNKSGQCIRIVFVLPSGTILVVKMAGKGRNLNTVEFWSSGPGYSIARKFWKTNIPVYKPEEYVRTALKILRDFLTDFKDVVSLFK